MSRNHKSKTKDTQTEEIKVPPHSIEAEQSVLGGLMLDNTSWDKVVELIRESDFYRPNHRLIFGVMVKFVSLLMLILMGYTLPLCYARYFSVIFAL